MEWDAKQEVTFDYSVHSHGDDRTAAVLTQLVELANLLTNHLGSNIDPNTKPTTPSQKKAEKVDVVRLATAKPIEQTISKGFVKTRNTSRDFTGRSISKEDEEEIENILPQVALVAGGMAANKVKDDITNKADPMSTSEGKALLASLQEAANKLRKYLMTTRVSASQAQKPSDMR